MQADVNINRPPGTAKWRVI